MHASLLEQWDRIRSSLWFVPGVMVALAVALAFAGVALDEALGERPRGVPGWMYSGGAEGAGSLLATIAGSMATIAGVVFSLTLVTLSLTSSQFGSRLLRNFMRDLPTQVVLGTFVATFLYCLLVLRTVRRVDEGTFVPHLSVTLAVLLALLSMAVLIYFIHHVAVSIQADEVIERLEAELRQTIDQLFPEPFGDGAPEDAKPVPVPGTPGAPIAAPADGYVQRVDGKALMRIACERDLVVEVLARPGAFVIEGGALARLHPAGRADDETARKLAAAFVLGEQRTPVEDLEFSVSQLVGIAARALSPDINDTATAAACIDRLGAGLCRLAARQMPSPCRYDESGRLRLVAHGATFAGVLDLALDPLRQYVRAAANGAASLRLLQMLATIGGCVRRPADVVAVRRQARLVVASMRGALACEDDFATLERGYQATLGALATRAIALAPRGAGESTDPLPPA
jgi:uncharacterized membrane protein